MVRVLLESLPNSIAKAHVFGRQQDAEACSAVVQLGLFLALLHLQVQVQQQQTQELLDLIDGEEPAGAHGGA